LDLRALYVYFLVEIGSYSAAKDFAVMTLKDFSKTDVYAMCAMAHLLYQQARESKDPKPDAVKDRISRFFRACEAFDRVLQLDPHCLFAAQGLAIALAENNLGGKISAPQASNPALQANNNRARNLRDALSILAKVRESANDENVFVNIGLCYFLREDFDRAIESVRSHFHLLCLCRQLS
jgi:RNA polymerase-associated protein CTR9